ncbi:hypothetical protein [Fulvivirga lutea]|uniref:Uncharacterized protein n=1 Tax=Fulvivirga lutea TaxID=2810512 RepID=A0A974WI78_9BACT|nr:hypothetical protein [Fulvivirga lutea]QSE98896.1 hypothetical protein JR347_07390 [Fulvivirga lutea]
MKKLLIFSAVLLVAFPLLGQRYKDVHPLLAKASDEEALSILKSYIIEDLDHPNANFRLALIYEKRYLESDPITEYERAMANANEAKLRFTKAAAVVDDREVSKNEGYYVEFATGFDSKGRPIVSYNTINQKIRNAYDSAKLFTEKMPQIYEYFTRSVDYHDRAIKLFNEINGQFNSRDKLLLLHNTNLQFKLEDLISDYDSSIVNLDKYLAAGKGYDPDHFNQSYKIKEIDTYRLQGLLTSPNFLTKNIEIWNYKKWAQEVIKEVETEVQTLRTQLNAAELELSNKLKPMSPLVSIPDYTPYQLDNKLIFELVKYDAQSLPLALLKYKQHKQDLIYQLGQVNDRDTTGSDQVYLVNLGELIYKSKDADSLIQIVESRVNEENYEKYESFFHTHYKGLPGINQFVTDEKKLVTDSKNTGVNEMLSTLNSLSENNVKNASISYKRSNISLTPQKLISLDSLNSEPLTIAIAENADGSKYLSGVQKQKDNSVLAFLLKTDANNRIKWYKEYDMSEVGGGINEVGGMAITPEGCAIMIRTKGVSGMSNTLYYVNENGEEIFKKPLDLPLYPREIKYIEATNAFVMVYKGATIKQSINTKEAAQLISVNILGDVLWSQTFEYAGTIVDLLTLDKGFMLVGNYSEITDEEGKNYRTRIASGQTIAFAARFGNNGKMISVQPVESTGNYFINDVIKVNDKIINLLGKSGTIETPESKNVHIIVNYGPDILHSDI